MAYSQEDYQRLSGCYDREEYLESLAEDYGAPFEVVKEMADLLGPDEDFDGLVSMVQEYYQ